MVKEFVSVLALIFASLCASPYASTSNTQQPSAAKVRRIMMRVADWQLAQPIEKPRGWIAAAWYAGLYAAAQSTAQHRYYQAMLHIGNQNKWKLSHSKYPANDYAVGQMYPQMYMRDHKRKMLAPIRRRLNAFLQYQWPQSLKWRGESAEKAWTWCDALFMAPPTLAYMTTATGNKKYLDKMSHDWWRVTGYLYDKKAHLYYRDSRFFNKKAANGKKVFWSRGNGWVMGGLVRVLSNMPSDYPKRAKFTALYKQMAAKIITLQSADGSWHPSLLDPDDPNVKEMSGTGFFVYALAWGINQHLLDRKTYLPHVLNGWHALVAAVNQQGRLGFVQKVDDSPSDVSADSTAPYGSGAFLLAGSEIAKLAVLTGANTASINVRNTLSQPRFRPTIELDWADVTKHLPNAKASNVVVVDDESGDVALSQTIDLNGGGAPNQLVFQGDFLANQHKTFSLHAVEGSPPPHAKSRVYGRFVPERKDDVAWESDRIAYRAYGPSA